MKRIIEIISLAAVCVAPLTSCEQNGPVPEEIEYTFEMDFAGDSKSACFVSGTYVNDYNLYFFADGELSRQVYSPGGKTTVSLAPNQEYWLYAIGNVGKKSFTPGMSLDSFLGGKLSFGSLSELAGIPCSYSPESAIIPSRDLAEGTYHVKAGALFAEFRIDLKVKNASDEDKLDIKSVSCFNINSELTYFGEDDKATASTVVDEGDFLSASDLSVLSKGGTVSFYAPENMQGTMDNPTYDYKIKKSESGLCTYVKIEGTYESQCASYLLKYIFYLGEDLYTSFNIKRNKSYDLHLTLDLGDEYLFDLESFEDDVDNPTQGPNVTKEVKYTLVPSTDRIDTWGGNEYGITFNAVDFRGDAIDVTGEVTVDGITFTGGAPDGLISWNGSEIVATDWWGMSGAWVTAGPTYTVTFRYGDTTATVSGTMNGHIGIAARDTFIYSEIERSGAHPPLESVWLYGSQITYVSDSAAIIADEDYLWETNSGRDCIMPADDIPVLLTATDPSNGFHREGTGLINVVTDVMKLNVTISPSFNFVNVFGTTKKISTSTTVQGTFLGNVGIASPGDYPGDSYPMAVIQSIWYEDLNGERRDITSEYAIPEEYSRVEFSVGQANGTHRDFPSVECWSLAENHFPYIKTGQQDLMFIFVNGFVAYWQWGYGV